MLVAISIFSLLAMATLAIDVVSLYVARNEIQRAADAAALVGAKALADSGVTTLQPGSGDAAAAMTMAQSMANSAITALVGSPGFNQVAGGPASLVGTPIITYLPAGSNLTNNPTISVTLQRTNLPIFFARIIGASASTASATAVAEAYNPANVPSFTPIAPSCVKPWLVANADPISSTPFVNVATGQVEAGVLGEQPIDLIADCNQNLSAGCNLLTPGQPPRPFNGQQKVQFVPALLDPTQIEMYPSSLSGSSNYERAIAGCDVRTYTFFQCGSATSGSQTSWDPAVDATPNHGGVNSPTSIATTQYLIHALGQNLGQGQDILTMDFPNAPPNITAQSGPKSGSPVSTSNSVVTIPIVDTGSFETGPPYQVDIVGFLQAFINQVHDLGNNNEHDAVNITVLNVVGCSSTPNGSPVIIGGNGNSAIPVRLISSQ